MNILDENILGFLTTWQRHERVLLKKTSKTMEFGVNGRGPQRWGLDVKKRWAKGIDTTSERSRGGSEKRKRRPACENHLGCPTRWSPGWVTHGMGPSVWRPCCTGLYRAGGEAELSGGLQECGVRSGQGPPQTNGRRRRKVGVTEHHGYIAEAGVCTPNRGNFQDDDELTNGQ